MNNWPPTSPLFTRQPLPRNPQDVLADLDGWSIAELLRGERFEPPTPDAPLAPTPSAGTRAEPATTASQPAWLTNAQWQATPGSVSWPDPPSNELPPDYPSHLGPVPQAPNWEQVVAGPKPWSPLAKPPRATDWGRTAAAIDEAAEAEDARRAAAMRIGQWRRRNQRPYEGYTAPPPAAPADAPLPPEQDPRSRYDGWSIPELLAGHRLAPATDVGEAAQAQEVRNAAAYRLSQSARPIGGREQGPVTDFILDVANPIPQSPLDAGLLALGAPLKPLVKALVLGASGALQSSDAEAGRRPRILGSAAARRTTRLPMDEEARIARARAMGYRMDIPLGHGTGAEFTSFDPSKLGTTTGSLTSRRGFWFEVDPQPGGVAERHANLAAERHGGTPQVMRLVHRSDNPMTYTMGENDTFAHINDVVAWAWDRGFDSVTIHNYGHGTKRGSILVVRDPAQLRDPSAVFDPRKRNSRDLFSSVNTAGPALG